MSTDTTSLVLDEKHPLVLELTSLKQAVAHYQLEAHRAKQQLQHQFNETRSTSQRTRALEDEVKSLEAELSVHRSHSVTNDNAQQAALQAQELSLALRRLSDKLDLTERNLADCKERLSRATFERDAAVDAKESILDVLVDLRQELENAKAEKRELIYRTKLAEEQARISDIAVEEYASLVRSMEGRTVKPASQSPIDGQNGLDGLNKARSGLQALLKESNEATEKLHTEIALLHKSLEDLRLKYDSQIQAMEQCTQLLGQTQAELVSLKNDDNTAAKMVSRYMKFSQSSTDALYGMLENLKKRHESTVESYKERIRYLEESRASERRQCEHFLRILDELTEDISRESYGRRREISLRMDLVAKEQLISEKLRRWTLRVHEKLDHNEISMTEERQLLLNDLLVSADDILCITDGGSDSSYSSYARLVSAATAVNSLQKELQCETDKRLVLEQQLISLQEVVSEREEHLKKGMEGKLRLVHMTLMPSLLLSWDKLVFKTFEDNSVQTTREYSPNMRNCSEPTLHGPIVQVDIVPTLLRPSGATDDDDLRAESPTTEMNSRQEEKDTTLLETPQSIAEIDAPERAVSSSVIEAGSTDSKLDSQDEDRRISCPTATVPYPSDSLLLSGNFPQEHWFKFEDASKNLQSPTLWSKSADEDHPHTSPVSDLDLLLSSLSAAQHRYDGQQKQFQDCSLSIQEMKRDFMDLSDSEKPTLLSAVVDRLFDFCEDSKVELEIRISDEERVIRGYQTLLAIPGALSDEKDEAEMKQNIEDFISGRDPVIRRAQETTQHKLEDLLHDIASVKQAIHDHRFTAPEGAKGYTLDRSAPEAASWTSWTGSLLSASRSPSPAPSFGAVMTSPKLRRSSSSQHLQPIQDSLKSKNGLGNMLDLRIHMPFLTSTAPPRQAERVRPRVISTAFGVGIRGGFAPSRATSFTLNRSSENTTRASMDYNNDVE